jgi:hypothetical protein
VGDRGAAQLAVLDALSRHMVAEETNQLDVVMATVSRTPRYVTAEAGEAIRVYFDLNQVAEFYSAMLGTRDVIGSMFPRRLTTDWYVFAEAYTAFRFKGELDGVDRTGTEFIQPIIAFIPAGEDGSIKGEFLLTRMSVHDSLRLAVGGGAFPNTCFANVEKNARTHSRLVAALNQRDWTLLADHFTDDAVLVVRDFDDCTGALTIRSSCAEIVDHFRQLLETLDAVRVINVVTSDWYVFAECDWQFRRGRDTVHWRSGEVFALEEGRIVKVIGYGTPQPAGALQA